MTTATTDQRPRLTTLHTTALYGTAYAVGDKIVWSCMAACATAGGQVGVNRAGVITALSLPIEPRSGRRNGSGPVLVLAYARPGEFRCNTCHRRSATVFPPDADGAARITSARPKEAKHEG